MILTISLLMVPAQAAPVALGWGDSGDNVKKVQSRLKQWGYYDGAVDAYLAARPTTRCACSRSGTDFGWTAWWEPDGRGHRHHANYQSYTSSTSGTVSSSLYLLAQAVHAEARGEPYTGMVAVAAVILNRVDSPRFPNTIAGSSTSPVRSAR